MGFFDRFKRKHEVAPSALPKIARAEPAQGEANKKDEGVTQKKERAASASDELRVLVKPVVSEKATHLATLGQYLFVVAPRASKGAIREAVRRRYGVRPVSVSVMRYKGKRVRFGRVYGMTKGYKKAIVTLPKGQRIDVLKEGGKE